MYSLAWSLHTYMRGHVLTNISLENNVSKYIKTCNYCLQGNNNMIMKLKTLLY